MSQVLPTMATSPLGIKYWPESYKYLALMENRIPKIRLGDESPYEILYKKKAYIADFQVWDSLCWANIPAKERKEKKLGSRAKSVAY